MMEEVCCYIYCLEFGHFQCVNQWYEFPGKEDLKESILLQTANASKTVVEIIDFQMIDDFGKVKDFFYYFFDPSGDQILNLIKSPYDK